MEICSIVVCSSNLEQIDKQIFLWSSSQRHLGLVNVLARQPVTIRGSVIRRNRRFRSSNSRTIARTGGRLRGGDLRMTVVPPSEMI